MISPVNLLPWELRRNRLMRQQAFKWGRVLLLLALLVTVVHVRKRQVWSGLQTNLAEFNGQITPLRKLDTRNKLQQTQLDSLVQRERLLNQLGAPFEPLQLISVLSSRACVKDGGVRILNLELSTFEVLPDSAVAKAAPKRSKRSRKPPPAAVQQEVKAEVKTEVSLYGMARDDLALSEFVTSLRHAGVFESIELKSADEVTHASGLTREYRVRCVL